jgi:hypothetical protein
MRIKSRFFIFIQVIILSFISYGVVKVLTFSQVKKEFATLEFIPDDANFVGRIDTKEIGKEILHEFISADGFTKLPKQKQDAEFVNMSFIDFDYPLYIFTKKLKDKQIAVAVLELTDQKSFLKSTNTKNENSFGICHNGKGFWVFNCPKNDSESIKRSILESKSTKWEKLRSSNHKIAFMAADFNLIGYADINENSLKINANLNSLLIPSISHKKLKTDGFNLTVSNPLVILKNLSKETPSLLANSLSGIKSISINHYGYRSPFFPNLSALIQVDSSFNLEESIKKMNSTQVEYENGKLYLGGAKFYVSKVQSDSYLLSYKENQTYAIENSNTIIESNGDLTQLVNFDDAPLMKMFLLSNSTISKIYSIIQKTEKFNFTISQTENTNSGEINLTLLLKKKNSFYAEMLSFIM